MQTLISCHDSEVLSGWKTASACSVVVCMEPLIRKPEQTVHVECSQHCVCFWNSLYSLKHECIAPLPPPPPPCLHSYYWVSLCCLSVPFSIIQSDSFLTFVIYTPHVCVFSRILNDLGPPSWSICQGTSKVVSSIKWNGFILIMLTTAWASFWRVHTA